MIKTVFKTAIIALSGLIAVTAFTLDLTPASEPQQAQAATRVTDSCPSFIKVTANKAESANSAVPPGYLNRFTYKASVSAGSGRKLHSNSVYVQSKFASASTSDARLLSPYARRSVDITYSQREVVGWRPIYETYRVRVPLYRDSTTRYEYYKPSPWAPGTWREIKIYYQVYNYETRIRYVGRTPIYGNVPYTCGASVSWYTGDKRIDVTHAKSFTISTNSKMSDPVWVLTAHHNGDALDGSFDIGVGEQSVTFRFNPKINEGTTSREPFFPNSGNNSLNARISKFNPYHSDTGGKPTQTSGINKIDSNNITFIHRLGFTRQSSTFGRPVYVATKEVIITDPTVSPGVGSAKANYSNTQNKIVSPYAGTYQQSGIVPCRVNSASLNGGTSTKTIKVSFSDRSIYSTLFNRNDGFDYDIRETIEKNSLLTDSTYVNSNGVYARTLYGGVPLAVNKPITLYRGEYSQNFRSCYYSLTGIRIGPTVGIKVYETVDLTGGHPSRINYLFRNSSFQAHSATGLDNETIVSSVSCLPEARGVKGLDIFDQWQGTTNTISYRGHFLGGAYNLVRDPLRSSTSLGNLGLGGRQDSDIWVTGFAPTTGKYAPGSRNPRSSIQCDYAKQSSQVGFDWERENPYLGMGKDPVYVGDVVSVVGAAASKPGDPGRQLLGNLSISLTGPGYSSSKSCANPCDITTFPELTRSGTYTVRVSWGGDAGLNGSSSTRSFRVYKYDTDLSFDTMLNGQGEADFTSTRPVPIKNTHLQNTSINWIPTVPAGDMGSNTVRVKVEQLQKNGSWSGYSSTITNANCLMASNPCRSEIGARILKQGQYRIQLEYVGSNKYNPSTSDWSNTFWVYEDFKCIGINNDDGVSMPIQWWENGRIFTEYEGNVLRSGNPMIINHPYVDGRDFTGIVRLDKIETSSYFMGTPDADGANVRLYEMPSLNSTEIVNLLKGEYRGQLSEHALKPNMPVQGRWIFDNVRTYNSWPLNDGSDYQTIVKVYDVSDILDPGLKMMQEVRVYGVYYIDGQRRTGSIACADEDAPQSGDIKFNKVTITE